jgi:hypothetical protein
MCYRFWKNGVQVDALRLKLPTGVLTGSNRFMNKISPLKFELTVLQIYNRIHNDQ